MPNKRDLKLDEYGIDRYQYRELCNFCLQYPKKKRRLLELRNPLHSVALDGLPHGGSQGEPTAAAAERAAMFSTDCEQIEQTAHDADRQYTQYIIWAVTEDIPWHALRLLKGLPLSDRTFRRLKRRFFYLLAQRKGMI